MHLQPGCRGLVSRRYSAERRSRWYEGSEEEAEEGRTAREQPTFARWIARPAPRKFTPWRPAVTKERRDKTGWGGGSIPNAVRGGRGEEAADDEAKEEDSDEREDCSSCRADDSSLGVRLGGSRNSTPFNLPRTAVEHARDAAVLEGHDGSIATVDQTHCCCCFCFCSSDSFGDNAEDNASRLAGRRDAVRFDSAASYLRYRTSPPAVAGGGKGGCWWAASHFVSSSLSLGSAVEHSLRFWGRSGPKRGRCRATTPRFEGWGDGSDATRAETQDT